MRNSLVRYQAHPVRIAGNLIEAPLAHVRIGELCEIRRNWRDPEVVAKAVVLGFQPDTTLLSLIGQVSGLTRDVVISPTGESFVITVSEQMMGSVISATGEVAERFVDPGLASNTEVRHVNALPPGYHERRGIGEPLLTGVRAIDGLLPCGLGQRMGIFAAAGCGKTTLMQMLIENAKADLFVIALIGERGREVTEFIEEMRQSGFGERCIVVYATSDYSAVDRMNAAAIAMTIAEYFRDHGRDVVLFLDSITRYARALRDVALLAGEPPARRGYPASVFERLPALLERPGVTEKGSITAFFTILLESEDDTDPVAEEIRSIIDGHIILSRKLASKNHYPAIDVLRSVSRVSAKVSTHEHQSLAGQVRNLMSRIEDLQVIIDFGEYQPGVSTENDSVYKLIAPVRAFLCQGVHEKESLENTLEKLNALIK